MDTRLMNKGFTIVELLIVIIVIGILAAISVVVFNGLKARGIESLLATDVRSNLMRVKQYEAVNGSYPSSAIPISTAEARQNDWHLKGSKRSLYNTFYFCSMAKNWGHPIVGTVFYIRTSDGRSYVANTDSDQMKEVTSQVTSETTVGEMCRLGVREGYMVPGIDGIVYPSGATQRIIFTGP